MSQTENAKKTILNFLSSEMESHAGMIIGFSVLLFTFLTLVAQQYENRVRVWPPIVTCENFHLILSFVVFVLLVWPLVYVTFRLAFYGNLTNKTIHYSGEAQSIKRLWDAVVEEAVKVKWFGLPMNWFREGMAVNSLGLWVSLLASFGICVLLGFAFWFRL